MPTNHRVVFESATRLTAVEDHSVDLIVTSPPYPMVAMWDSVFGEQNSAIQASLNDENGADAFGLMHEILDDAWRESVRVLRPGGFACINIGDATRTIGGSFRLYSNHSRIIRTFESIGMQSLPVILWRKQTNAPNKFMGSGMLPAGAYVTLEHEYILVFRKGGKRTFGPDDRNLRRRSAFFWEERNQWFSDVWDFKGVRQKLGDTSTRGRSAAFPFELAFRLINMYSLQGETVLDPFVGTGTTIAAALSSARNSMGVEIDGRFSDAIDSTIRTFIPSANDRQIRRYEDHLEFVRTYAADKGTQLSHTNSPHGFPVMTKQETDLELRVVDRVERVSACEYRAEHRALDDTRDVRSDHSSQLTLPLTD
ncbi:MAG: site-specific DNA-methyltransferase [Alkalispirochaeta sp.]